MHHAPDSGRELRGTCPCTRHAFDTPRTANRGRRERGGSAASRNSEERTGMRECGESSIIEPSPGSESSSSNLLEATSRHGLEVTTETETERTSLQLERCSRATRARASDQSQSDRTRPCPRRRRRRARLQSRLHSRRRVGVDVEVGSKPCVSSLAPADIVAGVAVVREQTGFGEARCRGEGRGVDAHTAYSERH